jgi:cysteinyl-tRNA synthetase
MLRDTKISKSIGNTISIKDILSQCTANQFRLLCLDSKYNQSFNYSPDLIARAVETERRLADFTRTCAFTRSRAAGTGTGAAELRQLRWEPRDFQFKADVAAARLARDVAFRTDFDAPAAISAMLKLVSAGHRYLQCATGGDNGGSAEGGGGSGGGGGGGRGEGGAARCVGEAAVLVGQTLELLGVDLPSWKPLHFAGWHGGASGESTGAGDGADPAPTSQAVDQLVRFRHQVRLAAIASVKEPGAAELAKRLLAECDSVRDALAAPGSDIELRDHTSGPVWHLTAGRRPRAAE